MKNKKTHVLILSCIIKRIELYNFKLQTNIRYQLDFLNDYLFNIPLVIDVTLKNNTTKMKIFF